MHNLLHLLFCCFILCLRMICHAPISYMLWFTRFLPYAYNLLAHLSSICLCLYTSIDIPHMRWCDFPMLFIHICFWYTYIMLLISAMTGAYAAHFCYDPLLMCLYYDSCPSMWFHVPVMWFPLVPMHMALRCILTYCLMRSMCCWYGFSCTSYLYMPINVISYMASWPHVLLS